LETGLMESTGLWQLPSGFSVLKTSGHLFRIHMSDNITHQASSTTFST
jgi:hypothetical protein